MAEEITKVIENVDELFPEIIVNGESHVSERYVEPEATPSQSLPQSSEEQTDTPSQQTDTPSQQTVQGEYVDTLNLNGVEHDLKDSPLSAEVAQLQLLLGQIQSRLNELSALIPSQASAQNQLADKDFVNSSIATNTANFLGTYTSLAEIEAIPNPTNNDYAFLETADGAGNNVYDRYKYSAEDGEWLFEYELNNSSFTAEQWATINSGISQVSNTVQDGDTNPVSSDAVYEALQNAMSTPVDVVEDNNMHAVTSNAVYSAIEDITKNTINKGLTQAGWYKICSCSYYAYGFALKIFLTSVYNNIPCVSHNIDVAYGWVNPKISETCYDNHSVFDKLMITYESNNACNIFVHYNRNEPNTCGVKIIGSSWGILQTFNFEPADISGFTDYAIFNLGTNGFYINGTNQDVVSSTQVNIAHHLGYAVLYRIGKVVFFSLTSDWTGLDTGLVNVGNIPQGYRPIDMVKMSEASSVHILMEIYPQGVINIYNYDSAFDYEKNGNYCACWITDQ